MMQQQSMSVFLNMILQGNCLDELDKSKDMPSQSIDLMLLSALFCINSQSIEISDEI